MALFFQSYCYIPDSDRKKTTLRKGNPHRLDHYLLGAVLCHGSLYNPPKQPKIVSFWLWDDQDFDPYDIQPSEFMVTKEIFDTINREMERVQHDSNSNFKDHYIIGQNLTSQLGFLYQRTLHFQISSPDNLYYTLLGTTPLELGMIAAGTKVPSKHLKPLYLPGEIKSKQSVSILSSDEVYDLYDAFKLDQIKIRAKRDLQAMMSFYYHLKSGKS